MDRDYTQTDEWIAREKKKRGEVSSFQALTATISASAGIGNVAGSAAAVSIGGPGVIFWMIMAGF